MATIIFSAIGYAIGGNIGSAIGAAIGQQVDQRVLGPKGQQGPRLSDLKIQTSNYAAPIPKVFGTMRLSGTVIWATDLREDRRKQSNGKGQPKTTVYSYSASFAVALSARRASRVGRIWADGKLLRGAAGDFKTSTDFRFYSGGEGQGIDPLIAAAEGMAATPAYRGLCYAVFEDFQLAEYGNRIPSLSFEIIGDEGGTTASAIIEGIAPPRVDANCPTSLGGFAAYGDSVRAVYQSLNAAIPFHVRDDGSALTISELYALPSPVLEQALGATHDAQPMARMTLDQHSSSTVPSKLSISYADPARDFQSGVQHARRDGGARREFLVELAAALPANTARALAERQLAARWSSRKTARIVLPWRYSQMAPGTTLQIPGQADVWQVVSSNFERMTVSLSLERVLAPSLAGLPATPGRSVHQSDQAHGPTVLRVLDLPPLEDSARASPLVVVCAAGTSSGWRSASLMQSLNGGASWQEAGATAAPATLGNLTSALATGPQGVFDMVNAVNVTLLQSGMQLYPVEDTDLLGGQNLAMIGSELIQFGRADLIAPNTYRLSRLLRGLRGTSISAHGAGSDFTLLERDSLVPLDVPVGASAVSVIAKSVGDPVAGVEISANVSGRALMPLSPAHLVAKALANGDIIVSWKRRSRDGWHWLDGVDAPLSEEAERYRVSSLPNVGTAATVEVGSADWTYTNAVRLADVGAGATSLSVSIVQLGTFAASLPAQITLPLS